MARFKVGDYVTIARLGGHSIPPEGWCHMIGKTGKVVDVDNLGNVVVYKIDTPTHTTWEESELEPSKEHKVLEILRKWNQTIKKTEE